jgi:hypothetical protein
LTRMDSFHVDRTLSGIVRCTDGYSGRDCGLTAAEAQARNSMQELVLERISSLASGNVSAPARLLAHGRGYYISPLRPCAACSEMQVITTTAKRPHLPLTLAYRASIGDMAGLEIGAWLCMEGVASCAVCTCAILSPGHWHQSSSLNHRYPTGGADHVHSGHILTGSAQSPRGASRSQHH